MSFEDLGLSSELLRAVAHKGYAAPTPVQRQAVPAVLGGRDVLAGAQTGTGKTAAFVLPLLQQLGGARGRAPRVLVLTPTRELAAQVAESVREYGAYTNLRQLVIFGGVGERPQIDALRAGCDLLIATPGRLLDLCQQGFCDLSQVRHLVLDEADRMLDMGFIHDIKRVRKLLPSEIQTLMFSATYSAEIRALAERMLRNPIQVEVAARNKTAERVEQVAFRAAKEQKRHLLVHLFRNGIAGEGPWSQVLVFTRTKHGANRLCEQLQDSGIAAAAIHGNKSQSARVRALADFKAERITALVATEVASRGLDIKELPHVVNYELPNVPEDYVHRIGRTARAGSSGAAISLVAPDEAGLLRDIERTMQQQVPILPTPAFEMQVSSSGASRPQRALNHHAPHDHRRDAPGAPRAASSQAGRSNRSAPGGTVRQATPRRDGAPRGAGAGRGFAAPMRFAPRRGSGHSR